MNSSSSSSGITAPVDYVGYWAFEEGTGTTVADSSVNGNDGTMVNSPTWETGIIGAYAGGFTTASAQRVNLVGTNATFTPNKDNAWSVSLWFKSSKADELFHTLFTFDYNTGEPGTIRLAQDETVNFLSYDGSTVYDVSAAGSKCDGLWHHVVATHTAAGIGELFTTAYYLPQKSQHCTHWEHRNGNTQNNRHLLRRRHRPTG
jgi:hypothetical protein